MSGATGGVVFDTIDGKGPDRRGYPGDGGGAGAGAGRGVAVPGTPPAIVRGLWRIICTLRGLI